MSPDCWPGVGGIVLCFLLSSGFCARVHYYHFVGEPKTWSEAQQYCRKNFTDLATISSDDDLKRLIGAVGGGFQGRVWIGLHDKPNTWKWLLTNGSFFGGQKKSYRNWAEGKPDHVIGAGKLCVRIERGWWHDTNCSNTHHFVCVTDTNETFVYVNLSMTWIDAHYYCKNNHVELASVRNSTDNALIQSLVPGNTTVWIGLHRTAWTSWSDRRWASYRNWAAGQPMSRRQEVMCSVAVFNATHNGEWVEEVCERANPFMCHNKRKHKFYVKLKVEKTTADLNDPAVLEAILKAIEGKVKDAGLEKTSKVSWVKREDGLTFHEEEEEIKTVKTEL